MMGDEVELPRIAEFYAGRSIFVTGFSGFMGKLLVEKLLRSCPHVDRIYVLLRAKKSMDYQQRLQDILNSSLFSRIREEKADVLQKVTALDGDVTLPGLGLSAEVRSTLCQQVSLFFHCAASVKFDDPLPYALDVNVRGTISAVQLALEMPRLDCFAHVSTAYSNCNNFNIEEKVYPPLADWETTLLIREKLDDRLINILSQKYMNHMPNTYVFTKSLAEHIVNDHSDRLPVVIFRPSIVTSTLEEPFPGWVDNLNGPNGLSVGCGTGVVRIFLVDTRIQPDFMPADLAIKGLIVAAFARVYNREEGVHMFNWCSNDLSITYDDFKKFAMAALAKTSFKYTIWRPTDSTTASYAWFYINFMLFQLLPAIFIDLLLRAFGQKPLLLKVQRKIFIAITALTHFLLNYFHFHNENAYRLAKYLREEDVPEFSFLRQPSDQQILKYFVDSGEYNRRWLFKMTPKDDENAEKMRKVLYAVDIVVKTGFFVYIGWKVYSLGLVSTFINSSVHFLFDF